MQGQCMGHGQRMFISPLFPFMFSKFDFCWGLFSPCFPPPPPPLLLSISYPYNHCGLYCHRIIFPPLSSLMAYKDSTYSIYHAIMHSLQLNLISEPSQTPTSTHPCFKATVHHPFPGTFPFSVSPFYNVADTHCSSNAAGFPSLTLNSLK
jgi:hypothetical protein